MAVKSIIDIEVNDEQFKKFADLFKKYQDQLKQSPPLWNEVGQQTKQTGITFEKLTVALLAQAEFAHKLTSEHVKVENSVKTQSFHWRDMARSSKQFAGNIVNATRSLLRWASLTSIISGLVGAGGLFGIERLAMAAGGMRRGALGLGVSPGEQRAFSVNYGRVVDPNQLLGGVNEALHDVTKRVGLYGAGLSAGDINGKNTAEVSAALIPALKRIADRTPEAMMAQVLRARHLDQFISLEDFQRLKNTPASEIGQYGQNYKRDITSLNLTKNQQKAWQDLQVQLTRAGQTIETTFIRGLTPLAPALTRLSHAFTHLVEVFMKQADKQGWLTKFSDGMDWLSKKLESPDFQTSITSFVDDIGKLARAIGDALHWLIAPGGNQLPDGTMGPRNPNDVPNWMYRLPFMGPPGSHVLPSNAAYRTNFAGYMYGSPGGGSGGNAGANDSAFGLPSGLTDSIWAAESSRSHDLSTSSAGARGPMQFMPGTWAQYGAGGDIMSEKDSFAAAGRYLKKLLREFGGDVGKAAAGYNWGEGNVERVIRQYGSNWRQHLPQETTNYVNKILRGVNGGMNQMARKQGVEINIHNNTGGSAVVTTSQLLAT